MFIYLFTSFSGHRPAQRECARTGIRMIKSIYNGTTKINKQNPVTTKLRRSRSPLGLSENPFLPYRLERKGLKASCEIKT